MERALPTQKTNDINFTGVKLSTHIHPPGFPALTHVVLGDIVQRIISNPQVKKVILFGSYANMSGVPTPDSDIDLLVIMDTEAPPSERILAVTRLLRPRLFPMDILVRTPSEIAVLQESGDSFFREILSQGLTLYER